MVLMHNEFSSMQRQLVTAEGMAAAANRRAEAAEAALQVGTERVVADAVCGRGCC